MPQIEEHSCLACGATTWLKACSRCKQAYFCDVECQRVAWKTHKHECAALAAGRVKLSNASSITPWNTLTDEARATLGERWRVNDFSKHLPGCCICASTVRLHVSAGTLAATSPSMADEMEIIGVADPGIKENLRGIKLMVQAAVGGACTTRVGAAPGMMYSVPPEQVSDVALMMRGVYSRGASGGTKSNPSKALLKLVRADAFPANAAAEFTKDALDNLLCGFTWAWIEVRTFDEMWLPCFAKAPTAHLAGVQVVGRLAKSRRDQLERLLYRFAHKLDAVCGLEVPVNVDVEFLEDPCALVGTVDKGKGKSAKLAPEPSARLEAACAETWTCCQCGEMLASAASRRCCLQCPPSSALRCESCAEAHDQHTCHVSLWLDPDGDEAQKADMDKLSKEELIRLIMEAKEGGDEPAIPGAASAVSKGSVAQQLAAQMCFSEKNVQPPMTIGCARGHHHPDAVCKVCNVAGFVGVLWRSATAVDVTMCGKCFETDRGTDVRAQSSAWVCLPGYGGGQANVFRRHGDPLYLGARARADTLWVTTVVYEHLWGQGMNFDAAWKDLGMCCMTPVPPTWQPKVRPIEELWERQMREFVTLSKNAGVPQPPTGATTAGSEQCNVRTLDDLCALEPLCREPLVFAVPHFLSSSECDHFARIGHHMCAPSAGGLSLALGTCEWPPLSTSDPLLADVEARVGVLVACAPHELDGGIKLQHTHHDEKPLAGTPKDKALAKAKGGAATRIPEGAHLDTNKRPHRHVTVLVYLNDVEHGGETVFPLAGSETDAKLLEAARVAAESGKHHTHDQADDDNVRSALRAINEQGERAAAGKGGRRVTPQKGTAVVFYSMGAEGAVDPATFHFGASITAPGPGKWTMQFFKELPRDVRMPAARAAYARAVHPLHRMSVHDGMVEVD